MTLKKKILLGYGVAFTLMGLVFAWAITNLVSLGRASDAILSENYRSILAAENMVDALERQDSGLLIMFLGSREKGILQFRENEANFLGWLARAKDNITIAGEGDLIQSIEMGYADYRKQFSSLTDFRGPSQKELQPDFYYARIFPLFTKIREACINLRELNEGTMYTASLQAENVAHRAIWSTAFVAAIALIVALIFSLFLAEKIVQPIRRFVEASRKISSGNYAVEIPVETTDEFGCLAEEFNSMASQLSNYNELNIDKIISEKNKAEAILSSIEDGLVVFAPDLKVTAINSAACRILSLDFFESSILTCADLFPEQRICELIHKAVETDQRTIVPDEQRIVSFHEGERSSQYLFSVTPVRRKDRKLSGIVLLLRDITGLRELERLKSDFVMAASHELRTPLTSLGMSIDLLLEHASKSLLPKDLELLQAAHEEVHRMKALANDLLDLNKIEAGKIDLEFEIVAVPTLFEHVKAIFKGQTSLKEIALSSDASDDLPYVRADANKITWVLSNLISNALRYVSKGGHIQLIAQKIGEELHISVKDDGPGIPIEYHSKIFQKFVQVKGREAGGTGLGLAICKEIVHAHGCAIWVESTPGSGSIFTFTLPVAN
ncbi:MAG: ATP-binding protein [Candidatus Riflebacteria bacterium]|nr:ATP-binding protein [Candidatus Riflebacteria bacterium]